MISDMMRKMLGGLAVALLIFAVGYGAAATHYAGKVAALKATIDAADKAARDLKKKQEETANEIKKQNDDRIAAINRYYQRLLRMVPAQTGASTNAPGATGADGASSEQGIAGCSVEFQQACVLDANKVVGWQTWALMNGMPTQ